VKSANLFQTFQEAAVDKEAAVVGEENSWLHRKYPLLQDVWREPPALAGGATLRRRGNGRNSINLGFSPGGNTQLFAALGALKQGIFDAHKYSLGCGVQAGLTRSYE
jgi:hypothetical protein